MKIQWDNLKDSFILTDARILSTNYMVRRRLYHIYGDKDSEIDMYLHALSHAYAELRDFIQEKNLVEFTEGVDEISDVLIEFAAANFKNPNLHAKESTDDYQIRMWNNTDDVFRVFLTMIAALSYHCYRYQMCVDDRKKEEREFYYIWLEIKKYNRDNNILFGFTNEELQGTLLKWYHDSIHPKTPNLFDIIDERNGYGCNEIIKKYHGPKPHIPASEMIDGYDSDTAI